MDLNRSFNQQMNPCNVELDIQELVLTDIPVRDPQGLKQAVTLELTRLIQTQGLPNSVVRATYQPTLNGGQLSSVATESLGVEIAQAIYQGLGGA